MRSSTVKTIIITALCCPIVLFAIWMIGGLIYESRKSEVEILDAPIEGFALTAETLDAYLREQYPDDCASKALTDVKLSATVREQRIQEGTLELSYFAYLNELREGGNIATVVFRIDPVSGHIVEIERYHGAGKGDLTYQNPVLDKTADFPLAWYVNHIARLTDIPDEQTATLYVRNARWGIDVRIWDGVTAGPVRYQERVVDWDAAAGAENRTREGKGVSLDATLPSAPDVPTVPIAASPEIVAVETAPPTPTATPAVMTPAPTIPADIVAPASLSDKQQRLYVLKKQIEAVGGRESPVGKPLFTEWLDTMLTPAQKQGKLSSKECKTLAYMANAFCSVDCFAWPEELTAETLLDIAGSYYYESGSSRARPPTIPKRVSGFSLEFPIYAEGNVKIYTDEQYNTRHAKNVYTRFSTMDRLMRSMVDVSLPPLSDTEAYSFLPTDLMEIAD